MDSAELLAATEGTSDLVFDPRCLCGDKPLACLDRRESMILFQSVEFDRCLVQAPTKFCINSTSIYREHPAPPELFKNLDGRHPWGRLSSAYAGVVALKQVDRF